MYLPDCGADPMQRAARRQGYLSVTDGVSSKGDLPPPLRFALLPEPPLARPRLALVRAADARRSEEPTSELQSLMRISYAVFCLKKQKNTGSPYSQNNQVTVN